MKYAPLLLAVLTLAAPLRAETPAPDPTAIVKDAIVYWRDQSSYTEANMEIHRPDWNRTSQVNVWTEGRKNTLVRFVAPPKDAGNASLKKDREMWSFSPKVNRTVKIPGSMMGQSWMGSDFSYNDLAKGDELIDDYDHKLIATEQDDGKKVYVIECLPHEHAPVVWGKETLKIREDKIILLHDFYDQEMKLVKRLRTVKISELGGKLYTTTVRMESMEEPDKWTQVEHLKAKFGITVPDSLFSLANLSNPRPSAG